MRIRPNPTAPFPALLLEPNSGNAVRLARGLEAAGFQIRVEDSVHAALQAQRQSFFFALIVVADLTDENCLAALDKLRRQAPRSWMIVAAAAPTKVQAQTPSLATQPRSAGPPRGPAERAALESR